MRLRRLELILIALTIAFAFFMGGYFVGRRDAVNIVTVEAQNGGAQSIRTEAASSTDEEPALPDAGASGQRPAGAAGTSDERAAKDNGDSEVVPTPAQIGAPRGGDGRININLATRSELMDLPGIGNVLAGRIIDYRQENGPFSRIEDIRNVSGIGEKRFEAIRDRITVG